MKRSFVSLLLLISASLASCWRVGEDWSLCEVDNNLILKFHVRGEPDEEFDNHINSVDVYLFDAGYNFLQSKQASENPADGLHRAIFTVDPGTYYVVCWANITDESRISFENKKIEDSYIEIASSESGSPIYYAPYNSNKTRGAATRADDTDYSNHAVNVARGEITTRELSLVKVHRTVEVFVSGWGGGKAPYAERTGAGGKYDFLLNPEGAPMTLKRQTSLKTVEGWELLTARFQSALIPITDDKWVYLCDPDTGETLPGTEVNLEQYVATNGIEDDSYIPIYYNFGGNVNVSITMPPWTGNEIYGK